MKIKRTYPLIILSLVFLFNPNINIIDIMPDCIAYILLILIIGNLSETVPYLQECKSALIKLALVTVLKLPALAVMYSNMQYGSDIVPLFTLSFATIELILIWSAVRNLFAAFSYVGERTDCASVREPFAINHKRTLTPEVLEKFTVIFFILKAVLNVLPEFMLLSRDDSAMKKQLADAYPATLVISVMAAFIIGAIWLKYALKYAKNIHQNGDLPEFLGLIKSYVHPEISVTERLVKKLNNSLTLLALSSIFTFDISLQNFGGYNILPHFIYGVIIFCSVLNLTNGKKAKQVLTAFTACFAISSVINQTLMSRFFSTYQYVDLSYSKLAQADYLPIKLMSLIEAVFVLATLATVTVILIRFIKEHTEVSPSDPSYGISNKKAHTRLIKSVVTCMSIAGIINVLKCANVFLKAKVTIISSAVNPDGIAASGAPFMNTAIFMLCITYVIYSFVMASTLKEEISFKYGEKE